MNKVLFFTFLMLLSCSDLKKETQQAKIKKLQSELSTNQATFEKEFIDTIHDMKDNASKAEQGAVHFQGTQQSQAGQVAMQMVG